jgi:glycosyltransferase involved in cell wall biosynthesis
MKETKISVIVPIYNGEKTLEQCLNSVLNQTYENYEVIVVDNNSTDRTKEIIKRFQKQNTKIKYVLEARRGRGAARNAGINNSTGDIIAMTDVDCIAPNNWLEEITKPIIYENEVAVMGSEKNLIKNYWAINIQKADLEFQRKNQNGEYISMIDTRNFTIKSFVMKNLMFDSQIEVSEDFDFYLRFKEIAKVRFKPSVIVEHIHKTSFKEVIKLNFNRGYWIFKIYRKFSGDKEVRRELMFESISLGNFLSFPIWMMLQFLTKSTKEAYFILVSEISWRSGIIWSIIKNNY